MEFITKNAEETKELGKKLAIDLIEKGKPLIIALTGELGSGKTTFVQGFAQSIGVTKGIISPTFILLRKYGNNFYHLDLYRLEENVEREVKNLGIEEIWKNPESIVVIEWAEKIKNLLPKETRWIKFETLEDNIRRIKLL